MCISGARDGGTRTTDQDRGCVARTSTIRRRTPRGGGTHGQTGESPGTLSEHDVFQIDWSSAFDGSDRETILCELERTHPQLVTAMAGWLTAINYIHDTGDQGPNRLTGRQRSLHKPYRPGCGLIVTLILLLQRVLLGGGDGHASRCLNVPASLCHWRAPSTSEHTQPLARKIRGRNGELRHLFQLLERRRCGRHGRPVQGTAGKTSV